VVATEGARVVEIRWICRRCRRGLILIKVSHPHQLLLLAPRQLHRRARAFFLRKERRPAQGAVLSYETFATTNPAAKEVLRQG
jgi:hypothetical protein